MDSTMDALIKHAYATPAVRANLVNSGMISLYCDYSGSEQHVHAVACTFVFNRTLRVQAKRLEYDHVLGSDYGELQAIYFSLEWLARALTEEQLHPMPKSAVVWTDCHAIERLLTKASFADARYAVVRDAIHAILERLRAEHPDVEILIKHMHRHKTNNALHRMAHNAARKCIGK
ncbi:hypothetical protein [Paenibacillus sp. CF384]|uniref:hypothetical protein n=1 Tax=Paenibacillus sp. CF384 TaxID=1884382 RepID=UPI00089A61BA|nr:hypothetical protein [Paenibacillus sp. CF384]SDW20852.1 hypothetical protein SAMN05518855_1001660 [Paenibacillus sp. CF384]